MSKLLSYAKINLKKETCRLIHHPKKIQNNKTQIK